MEIKIDSSWWTQTWPTADGRATTQIAHKTQMKPWQALQEKAQMPRFFHNVWFFLWGQIFKTTGKLIHWQILKSLSFRNQWWILKDISLWTGTTTFLLYSWFSLWNCGFGEKTQHSLDHTFETFMFSGRTCLRTYGLEWKKEHIQH